MRQLQALLICALFVLAGWIVIKIDGRLNPRFSGKMLVPVGRQECLAIGDEAPQSMSAPYKKGFVVSEVLGSEIPFVDPEIGRNRIEPGTLYAIAQLPFYVRLDHLKALPRPRRGNHILVMSPDGEISHAIAPGSTVPLPGTTMRIESIGQAADSPLSEAAVEIEGERMSLREGESVRWNDLLLRFDPDTRPPLVHSRVTLVGEGGAALESFGLSSGGQSVEYLNWRFAQAAGDSRDPTGVALLAISTPATRSLLGLRTWGHLLFVGGLGGLLVSLTIRIGPAPHGMGRKRHTGRGP